MQTPHSRRTYDYRIQEAICETGNRDTRRPRLLLPELNIPRSTIRSWIHRGVPDVVTCDLAVRDRADLLAEIHQYQHRAALLGAVVGLPIAMLRVSKTRLDYEVADIFVLQRVVAGRPVTVESTCQTYTGP
jgi:hypothetical protein